MASAMGVARMPTQGSWRPKVSTVAGLPARSMLALGLRMELVGLIAISATMSWPVAGTLMVEPTESESQEELDRFITAMRSIRREIQAIIDGEVAYEDSVLHHAPFTAASVSATQWPYAFSREEAAWPVASLYRAKYFPPVRRIDEAYGDRNLVCSCPAPEAFDISGDHAPDPTGSL